MFGRNRVSDNTLERVQHVENALAEVSSKVDSLEHEMERLAMEWEDWFEKFGNLYKRLNARHLRSKPEENGKTDEPPMNPLAQQLLSRGRTR